jgi:hypothetical protein
MVWTTILDCFTTGAIADIGCIIGGGTTAILGSGLILAIVALIAGVFLVYKMRLPLDLTALGLLGIVGALSYSILPSYVFYVGLLLIAVVAGYGFYRWTKR